ncbi:gasdermin [Candidatus Viridilinea mediisalina]|uniref:gasdermin n=1 Tax=Candidatus Viridilinea mediisalina TaxID=2024553 RepID=UPI0026A1F6F2
MTLFRLCREDPLVSLVHELYGANMVRIPDARVRPLSVVLYRQGRSFFRGSLLPLLDNAQPLGLQPQASLLTDISGRRSRRVTLDLGLHILRGFLSGFGLPHASLEARLNGAAYLAFAFPAAKRSALDINALGWALTERRIARHNPAATMLFSSEPYELFLIDSIITSHQIAIVVGGTRKQRLNLDLAALREALAELGGSVETGAAGEVELIISSKAELTFAFSCVRVCFDHEGQITSLPPDPYTRTLSEHWCTTLPLTTHPGLLVWDERL